MTLKNLGGINSNYFPLLRALIIGIDIILHVLGKQLKAYSEFLTIPYKH